MCIVSFSSKMISPAVIIKLYCFKLLFEKHFCLNNGPFVFSITDSCFDFGHHTSEISLPSSNSLQNLKQIEKRLLRYCTFIFSLSCQIVSVTSYLHEREAENLQNGGTHFPQIPDFWMGYLENPLAH